MDADGNLTTAGGDSYTYNAAGALTAATVGGKAATYTVNADGGRVAVTSGGSTSKLMLDVASDLPGVLAETGHRYTRDTTWRSARRHHVSWHPFAVSDAQGTIRALTDSRRCSVRHRSLRPVRESAVVDRHVDVVRLHRRRHRRRRAGQPAGQGVQPGLRPVPPSRHLHRRRARAPPATTTTAIPPTTPRLSWTPRVMKARAALPARQSKRLSTKGRKRLATATLWVSSRLLPGSTPLPARKSSPIGSCCSWRATPAPL